MGWDGMGGNGMVMDDSVMFIEGYCFTLGRGIAVSVGNLPHTVPQKCLQPYPDGILGGAES